MNFASVIPAPSESALSADEFERQRRRDLVLPSWQEVPRHQLKWRCAKEFEQAVREWEPNRSLLLLGLTGTGKTTACVRIVAKLCHRAVELGGNHILPARSLCWIDADDLTLAGGREDLDSTTWLSRSARARVLVLDDVASGSKTLHRILRARLRKGLPTVLTSGMTKLEELRDAIGGDAVLRHVIEATGVAGDVYVAKESR